MPLSRATVFERSLVGVEALSDPGTAVAATKQMQAFGFELSPKIETKRFRPVGYKYDTLVIPGKDSSELKVDGQLDYNNIVYPLASVMNTPSISTVGTNGRLWDFTSASVQPDGLQTYTIDRGSGVRGERVTNVAFTGLDLSFKRDDATLSGSAIGTQLIDPIYITGPAVYTVAFTGTVTGGTFTLTFNAVTSAAIPYNATSDQVQAALWAMSTIGSGGVYVSGGPATSPATPFVVQFATSGVKTLTGTFTLLTGTTPGGTVTSTQTGVATTEVVALPLLPGSVNVFVDPTSGAIGTTKLLRVLQADISIGDRVSPLWVLNSTNASYATTLETPPNFTLKLKLEANAAGMAYLSNIRAGTSVFARVESVGPALPSPDGAFNYKFRFDMATKIESPDSMGDSDGDYTVDWMFRVVHDSVLGYAAKIQVTNLLTAL